MQASRIDWMDGGRLPYLGQPLTLVIAPAEREVVWDSAKRELRLPLPLGAAAEQIRDLTHDPGEQQQVVGVGFHLSGLIDPLTEQSYANLRLPALIDCA